MISKLLTKLKGKYKSFMHFWARLLITTTLLQQTSKHSSRHHSITIDKQIPAGADIGEMMIHTSDELTMIYARVPPYFMSAVHNHTLFACIGCLEGKEDNTIYSLQNGSVDLPPKIDSQFTITSGEVIELPHVSI